MAKTNTFGRSGDGSGWKVRGVLAAALALGAAPALADRGEAWDDSHMRSRLGGARSAPLEASRIEGANRFAPGAAHAAAPTGVSEQWLPASQHPWSRRASGLGNVPGHTQAARRPAVRTESRHNRNPAAWSRASQSSALRAGAVRRSAGGR